MKPTQVFILTLAAMVAFAGNSLLCRAALRPTGIDAASFTFIRLFSGALSPPEPALFLLAFGAVLGGIALVVIEKRAAA